MVPSVSPEADAFTLAVSSEVEVVNDAVGGWFGTGTEPRPLAL